MSKTISVGPAPRIVLEKVAGHLSVVGWDGDDVLIKGDQEQIRTQEGEGALTIACDDDLALRVPRAAGVSIQRIHGDAALRSLAGAVELESIDGDLSVRDVAQATIRTVRGDLHLHSCPGSVSVKSVQGDVSVRDVAGDVTLEAVANDLTVRNLGGSLTANAGEDVILYLDPKPGQTYAVTAGDDILLVMPPSASVTLTLHGDEVSVDWPGVPRREDLAQVVKIGDGAAAITLNAGGDVRVTNQAGAGASADEFGNFAGINFDWGDLGREFGERIARRADETVRRVDRATKRAEEQMARTMARQFGHHLPPTPPIPPIPPVPPISRRIPGRRGIPGFGPGAAPEPRPAASDEERMAILKMLQEKKITSEQADQLLSALEGGA
jgi:hypothetical protein